MSTDHPIEPKTSSSFGWQAMLKKIFSPSADVTDIGQRRQAQVVAWMSLIQGLWFLIVAVIIVMMNHFSSSTIVLSAIMVLSFVAYAFSRTRWYSVASWILVTLLSVAAFALRSMLPEVSANPTYLGLVILAFVIGSIVLNVRGLSVVVVVNSALCIILLIRDYADGQHIFFGVFGSIMMIGILLVVFSSVRDLVERERMQEVQKVNHELIAFQETLEQRVAERSRTAELALQQAEQAQTALEDEIWLTSGLVELNQAMHGEDDLSLLANRAMQVLCKHLSRGLDDKLVIGAIFIAHDDRLDYAGGYAHSYQIDVSSKFQIGEGLLGQVARDRQPIFLDQVPAGYLTLVSGLGDISTEEIAIWPLLYEDQLVGVMELGLFSSLPARCKQFIERAADSMAIVFDTVEARIRINELLTETQAQSEELQVREEELRAINEELMAQTEQMEKHT